MVEILRAAVGQDDTAVGQEIGLRSVVEDRWRGAATTAGSSELERIRRVDPELVEKETWLLGAAAAPGGRAPACWRPAAGRGAQPDHRGSRARTHGYVDPAAGQG